MNSSKKMNQDVDEFQLKFRKLNKSLYFDFISRKNTLYQKILECFLNTIEFDITVKSGINADLLFNESFNEEIIDSIFSFLITLKTSKNIEHIINSLYLAFKKVNYNNNIFQEFYDFFIKYIKNKDCLEIFKSLFEKFIEESKENLGDKFKEELREEFGEEYEEELGEKSKEKIWNIFKLDLGELLNINDIYDGLREVIINEFKEFLDSAGLMEYFLLLDLDSIKLLFYSLENNNGVNINLKIKNITKVLFELLHV